MSQIILTKEKKNRNRKNTELKEITKLKENDNCTENMVAKESDSCLSNEHGHQANPGRQADYGSLGGGHSDANGLRWRSRINRRGPPASRAETIE